MQLAREADGEVADVDHLLHLAQALRQGLAGFQGDQGAEIGLGGAQFFAEQADELAPARRGDLAPGEEGGVGGVDGGGGLGGGVHANPGDLFAGDRRRADEIAPFGANAETLQQRVSVSGDAGFDVQGHAAVSSFGA